MHRFIVILFAAFLTTSQPATADTTPYVSVKGTAMMEVVPDQMDWELKVKNTGPALPDVAQAHNEIVQRVLDFLKQTKIDEAAIQTSRMEFDENTRYKDDERIKDGYYASTHVTFRILDLDLYQPLWMGLAAIEGVSVENVTFEHSKRTELRNETRRKALMDTAPGILRRWPPPDRFMHYNE